MLWPWQTPKPLPLPSFLLLFESNGVKLEITLSETVLIGVVAIMASLLGASVRGVLLTSSPTDSSPKYIEGKFELIAVIKEVPIFPEECVAELFVFQRRLKRRRMAKWKINLRLFQECVSLLFVFYVRVKVENLFLPSSDLKIDD